MKRNVILLTSQAGETLDCVLYRHKRADSREDIIALNPHLAQLPSVLPEGTAIAVPEGIPITQKTTIPSISLWD